MFRVFIFKIWPYISKIYVDTSLYHFYFKVLWFSVNVVRNGDCKMGFNFLFDFFTVRTNLKILPFIFRKKNKIRLKLN